jgi:hypothetical protein
MADLARHQAPPSLGLDRVLARLRVHLRMGVFGMNRRQFIAGLMASTVAPAPPVPRLTPEMIYGMAADATRAGLQDWYAGGFVRLWFDADRAEMVIDRLEAQDFYLNDPGI